jgi:hypothetical protein
MKFHKNCLVGGGGAMLLLVSFVLGAPRTTWECESKSVGSTKPVALVQPTTTRLPLTPSLVVRARLSRSSISQAAVSDRSDDLSIGASLGDENMVLERKKKRKALQDFVFISVNNVSSSSIRSSGEGGTPMIDLRATITGADAVQGSLLYALAWLAGDADPLGSVRSLGYDISVHTEQDRPCTDRPPGQLCVEHARQLATLIDAALSLGSHEQRAQFRQDASEIGLAPDCGVQETVSTAAVLASENLSIDASLGNGNIVLARRKAGGNNIKYIELKLEAVRVSSFSLAIMNEQSLQRIDLNARITGADRLPGSLLYALAWLAGDADPMGSVRALGYDIDVSKEHDRPCTEGSPSQVCVERARRLATLLDATLGLGSPDDRILFRQNAAALGAAPDCFASEPEP